MLECGGGSSQPNYGSLVWILSQDVLPRFVEKDLRDAGFSAWGLRNCGFLLRDLHHAGYSEAALKAAGFQLQERHSLAGRNCSGIIDC